MKKVWIRVLLVFVGIIVFDRVILPFYTSSGRDTTVPDVRNLPYEEADRVLKRSGLHAQKSYNFRYLPDVSANVVLDQVPTPQSTVKPGRNVYLVLNRLDKPSYPMPELGGRAEGEARQALARIGMVVDEVQFRAVSNPDEEGRVLNQSIPPNVVVRIGSAVSLIVGKYEVEPAGMKRVVVPEVLGMSLDQAKSTLIQQGLTVGKITWEYSSMLVPNTVISQKPSVNSFAPAGQAIDMTVVTNERK
ncbi:MAG: PASTA domain-containing protein [Chlorobiaceae bacterium]|nr:PASTA domain-containing protein [Chlorobiaceae bacterium]